MAFLVETLRGAPYSAYAPPRLAAMVRKFGDWRTAFQDVDRSHRAEAPLDAATFQQQCELLASTAAMSGDLRPWNAPRASLAEAIDHLGGVPRWSTKALCRANGLLTNESSGRLRSGPVWMDAPHPSQSWFVAPPVRLLDDALQDLCRFCTDESWPTSQRAAVALLRLLQIHPFSDANGRTARAAFVALHARDLPVGATIPRALGRLWEFRGMHLHRASMAVRDQDDWAPYFELVLSGFKPT